MPRPADIIAAQLTERRLNSRDKALQQRLGGVEGDLPADELSVANIASLLSQLQRARHPLERATLQAELDRLRSLADNLGQAPEGQPSTEMGPQTLPYSGGEQTPVLQGGTAPVNQPFMDGAPTGLRRVNSMPMPNPTRWPMPNMPQGPRG